MNKLISTLHMLDISLSIFPRLISFDYCLISEKISGLSKEYIIKMEVFQLKSTIRESKR